jgi:hypothetical protein
VGHPWRCRWCRPRSTSRSCSWTWRWSERCARWPSQRRTTLVAVAARRTRKRTRNCKRREPKGSASPSCWRLILLPFRQESILAGAGETACLRRTSCCWRQQQRQHRSYTSAHSLPLGLLQLLRVLRQWSRRSSRAILPWTSPRLSSGGSDVLR